MVSDSLSHASLDLRAPYFSCELMSPFHIPVVTGITQALGAGPGGQSAHSQFSGLRFPLSSARRLCRDGTVRVLPKIGFIKKKKHYQSFTLKLNHLFIPFF